MTTAAQVQSNRENAQHSTGPRTEEGKNATRYNAYKHGAYADIPVKPGESQDGSKEFHHEYLRGMPAQGLPQILCVEGAAVAEWKLRQLLDFEAESIDEYPDAVGEYPYWVEQKMIADRQTQIQRSEVHLIRARDKHLAQLRRLKKDRADESEEADQPMTSRRRESVAATIPVAVQPEPEATSPVGAAAETASDSPEELARREAIREETAKFIEYLNTRRFGLSEAERSQEIENHLKEIGLVVDSPQTEVN